ncbi:MAG: PRD domain-containing protein [Propionicimonas sp.]
MRAIKKINNNVAHCLDGNGNELVAVGRGIGFPAMPYEVDLARVTMTFYRLDEPLLSLVQQLPGDVLLVSADVVQEARRLLPVSFNANLVVSLADHINFAILRMKKFRDVKLPFSHDIQHFYPRETAIGRYAVKLVQRQLQVTLPESEVTAIAMHVINAEETNEPGEAMARAEVLIEKAMKRIEVLMDTAVDRAGVSYNRFVTHLRYYITRIGEHQQVTDDTARLIDPVKADHPQLYQCALEVGDLISRDYGTTTTESEILYLALHINRMLNDSVIDS